MATAPAPRLTAEEYLALDRSSEVRNEYHGGEVFPVETASLNHADIQGNLYWAIRKHLTGSACKVMLSAVRLRIPRYNRYTYPDLMIICGKADLAADKQADTLLNPAVIFEILSPSTEGFDRGEKFALYRSLPSLREYVLVAQDRMLVEVYRRENETRWGYEAVEMPELALTLDSVGIAVPLVEIYEQVELSASPR